MSLPKVSEYSSVEISEARAKSQALGTYLDWLSDSSFEASEDLSERLRYARHKNWCQAALASLTNRVGPREICHSWSEGTLELLQLSWKDLKLDKEPLALFALGKLGARELNLSSDVDLLCIGAEGLSPNVVQRVRAWSKILSEYTQHGFGYRVDWDLRPGGKSGPFISTLTQAEHYYWTHGEGWERLAMVRLLPIEGSSTLVKDFCELSKKYAFRKYTDFTLFDELRGLRQRIHESVTSIPNSFHLKLHHGGIRDIELFVHALQIIHGGKHHELQMAQTSDALLRLANFKLLTEGESQLLLNIYWQYRDLENKVQALEDKQTHVITDKHLELFDIGITLNTLQEWSDKVNLVVTNLLGVPSEEVSLGVSELSALGFSERSINQTWSQIQQVTALSKKTQRDERVRQSVLKSFAQKISDKGNDLDLGLSLLLDFVRSTRAKSTFFHLLSRVPRLVEDLSVIFSTSPYLGAMIASRPELIDSWIYGLQSEPPADTGELLEYLVERKLLAELLAARDFLAQRDLKVMTETLSGAADEIFLSLLNSYCSGLSVSPPKVLALGKWGGQELGLGSDLDFLFISEASSPDMIRALRKVMTALTAPQKGGSIFSIDLRLRPSGRAGPLVVTPEGLLEYLETKAEAWERQSYLRARVLPSTEGSSELSHAIRNSCARRGLSGVHLEELRKIRKQLVQPSADPLFTDLKYASGGLIDLEFAVQICLLDLRLDVASPRILRQIKSLRDVSQEQDERMKVLEDHYLFFRGVEQLNKIVGSHSTSKIIFASESFKRLARLMGESSDSAQQIILERLRESASLLKNVDPIWKSS